LNDHVINLITVEEMEYLSCDMKGFLEGFSKYLILLAE